MKNKLKIIGIIILILIIALSIKVWFDINSTLKEYDKIEKVDISDVNKITKKNVIDPLVYEINEVYSKEIYKSFKVKAVNDNNNIFFKKNFDKTEKIIKDDFKIIFKKYMDTSNLFKINNYLVNSEADMTGILNKYSINYFFDFLSGYIYYLKNIGEIELANKILNKLTTDLNNAMNESSFIDFAMSLIVYDILHINNLCTYSNSIFKKDNSTSLKNKLFDKLNTEIEVDSYALKDALELDNDDIIKFKKKYYIHALKLYKYNYQTLKKNRSYVA